MKVEEKDTEFSGWMQEKYSYHFEPLSFAFYSESIKLSSMTKETRLRIIIVLALIVGYVVVAVFRSGTAW